MPLIPPMHCSHCLHLCPCSAHLPGPDIPQQGCATTAQVLPDAVSHHRQLAVGPGHAAAHEAAEVLRGVVQLERNLTRAHVLQELVQSLP